MKTRLVFFLALPLLAFASEQYGVYDPQGKCLSTFEAEPHELPEKAWQIKNGNPHKNLYVSSLKKGKGSKPSSRYKAETGAYIEASRNETFSICPEKKSQGTWISEYSVALDEKNCISVQAPDLAGTFRVLFMENSGLTDTIQVLVEQSYIQMGDYSHTIFVVDSNALYAGLKEDPHRIYISYPGNYENRSYTQPLIVDKTKFTMGDAQYYFKMGNIETIAYSPPYSSDIAEYINKKRGDPYIGEKLEGSNLPLVSHNDFAWILANERSKKEGLDTAYYRDNSGSIVLDTSALGYRLPSREEWYFLMRAGVSTIFFWGNENPYRNKDDSLRISRYVWVSPPIELKPVAQLLPNAFGLYDMIGIATEFCDTSPESFVICKIMVRNAGHVSFRLLRKTPKLHKLEKF